MKLGNEEMRYLQALEIVSGVNAKDCVISKNKLTYLIESKDLGKAIGKNGKTVKELTERMGKNIELMEYSSDANAFVKKALNEIKIENSEISSNDSGKKIVLLSMDSENRRKLLNNIGKLKRLKDIVKREYDIDEIRIK
ncbi:MAG: NusA-like transcription termination signal-binding factor [Candidatus Diapherotrites archaeon]|nr:NusA-like transcription termination signal-binding factor [Candidatus Diapherotrites archaeon]